MFQNRSEKFFADIADFIKAEKTADLVINKFHRHFWRLDCYIPTPSTSRQIERGEAIRRDFRGNNHFELAALYGVSVQTVYKAVREKPATPPKPAFIEFMDEILPAELAMAGMAANDATVLCDGLKSHILSKYAGSSFRITDQALINFQKRRGALNKAFHGAALAAQPANL